MSILIELTADQIEALKPFYAEAHMAAVNSDWTKRGTIIAQIRDRDMKCGFVPYAFAKRIHAIMEEWVRSENGTRKKT